jgi:hypothetical protein
LNIASSLSDAKNKFKQIACIIVIIIMMYKAQCHYYLGMGWWSTMLLHSSSEQRDDAKGSSTRRQSVSWQRAKTANGQVGLSTRKRNMSRQYLLTSWPPVQQMPIPAYYLPSTAMLPLSAL